MSTSHNYMRSILMWLCHIFLRLHIRKLIKCLLTVFYFSLCFFIILIFFFFFHSRFLLVIYFIHISVYMSIPISQFIPPIPPPPGFPLWGSISLFSTPVPRLFPCKLVHLYHFSRFHIYVLIYDICFSPSDLVHSV